MNYISGFSFKTILCGFEERTTNHEERFRLNEMNHIHNL